MMNHAKIFLFVLVLSSTNNPSFVPANAEKSVLAENITNSTNHESRNSILHHWSEVDEASPPLTSVVIMALIAILSPFLNTCLLFFLQDLPLTKQCIMNTLYQDVIRINLALVSFWTISGMISKFLIEMNKIFIISIFNEILAAVNEALASVIVFYLSLIGGLRLFTTRYHILDPLTHFFGEKEENIIRSIRFFLFLLSFSIVSAILASSTKLITYFSIRGECSVLLNLPLSSKLMLVYDVGMVIICILLHVSAKIYQNMEDAKLRRDLLELEVQLNNSRRKQIELEIQWNKSLGIKTNDGIDALKNSKDSDMTNDYFSSIPYLENLPVIVYMINCVLITFIILSNCLDVSEMNFWWIITIFTANQGLLIPMAIGFWYPDIRLYFCRNAPDTFMSLFSGKRIRYQLSRRSMRRISPYDEEIETA